MVAVMVLAFAITLNANKSEAAGGIFVVDAHLTKTTLNCNGHQPTTLVVKVSELSGAPLSGTSIQGGLVGDNGQIVQPVDGFTNRNGSFRIQLRPNTDNSGFMVVVFVNSSSSPEMLFGNCL
jgi:hypothetical protein